MSPETSPALTKTRGRLHIYQPTKDDIRMLLRDIARALSAQVIGDDSLLIERIVHPADARGATDLAVAMSDDSFAALGECRAHAVVIAAESTPPSDQFRGIVVTDTVRQSMAILTRLFGAGLPR